MTASCSRSTDAKSPLRNSLCLVLCAALLSVSAVACKSMQAAIEKPFPLYGMVYDENGQGVAGVSISLGKDYHAESDYNGRFAFGEVVRGTYPVQATKKGMETFNNEITISGKGDIVYLKMISVSGLYAKFTEAFKAKNWDLAESYLTRALAVEANSPILLFAKAAYLYAPERPARDWEAAETILRDLVKQGVTEPAVFLLLADIAQYDKKNKEEAAWFLKMYLDLYYNPAVEARLRSLEG